LSSPSQVRVLHASLKSSPSPSPRPHVCGLSSNASPHEAENFSALIQDIVEASSKIPYIIIHLQVEVVNSDNNLLKKVKMNCVTDAEFQISFI
jgi:hypothetical protein